MTSATIGRTAPSTIPSAPETPPRKGERLSFVLGVVLFQTILTVLSFALLGAVAAPAPLFTPTPETFLACVAIEIFEVVVVVWLLLGRWGGLSLERLGWRKSRWPRDLLWGVLGFAAMAVLLLVAQAAGGVDPLAEVRAWFLEVSFPDRALWFVIGVGIPLTEESIFRGAMQPVLTKKLGRYAGVLTMAVIFSLYHLPRGPLPFVSRLLCGLVLGALRERTNGLVAPWTTHFLIWLVIGTR